MEWLYCSTGSVLQALEVFYWGGQSVKCAAVCVFDMCIKVCVTLSVGSASGLGRLCFLGAVTTVCVCVRVCVAN